MGREDFITLVTAVGDIGQEEESPRPSTCGAYESFESFIQTLAPSLPGTTTDDASIFRGISSASRGTGEIAPSASSSEAVSTPEEEVQRLKNLVDVLQVRLDATTRVVEIHEKELCREMEGDEESRCNYEKLLNRWRREVCILLLKQRVDALQVEQRRLQQMQKEQHLTVQLHEARALVEVLKQKERNLQAEIGILTTGQKLAEMTMRAEAARRQHELEGTVKGVTRAAVEALSSRVDEHSAIMFHQLERLIQASCRLDLFGQRLRFSEQQVMMVVNSVTSVGRSSGNITFRKKLEENMNMEKPRSVDRKRDRSQATECMRRSANDHAGRASQLEVMLAATKLQLTEECMHTKELQERLGKTESEAREATKKAVRKAQEQAERDLVSIKRQHSQIVQSLHNRISKLQNEHAKSIAAHHQLERKLFQQQQEFVHTLNQRDNEFRKSLDAKEIEVNGLLDEQNALLNKLKKFWRPMLNSSAAKIFTEKNQRSHLQTPTSTQDFTSPEYKSRLNIPVTSQQGCSQQEINFRDKVPASMRSVETQTVGVRREKTKKTSRPDDSMEPLQENTEKKEHQDRRNLRESRPRTSGSLSRWSTSSRKNKLDPKVKKNEEDLITTYLSKLQRSYVSSNKQHSHLRANMNTRSLDSLLEKTRHIDTPPSASLSSRTDHHDGRVQSDARPISRQSPAFSDCPSIHDESLPQYIICVSPQVAGGGNGNGHYTTAKRKKQAPEHSNSALQEKLENLEALSETLLGQRM